MPNKKEEQNTAIQENSKNSRQEAFARVIRSMSKVKKDEDPPINFLPEMNVDIERFTSGSLILDSILGGGLPKGRIIEIYGGEACGKTSIALTAIAHLQKKGGNCVFIDAESALDVAYAKKLGVDLDKLAFSQESIAETLFDMILSLAGTGTVDLIVVDSVASLTTQTEFEESVEKVQMAGLARVMSKGLKKLAPVCSKNKCTVIFLNQTRDNVGVMFGSKVTTSGGNALKFFASQRIQVSRTGVEKDENGEVIGTTVKLRCVKNKTGIPFGEGLTSLEFNRGINPEGEVLFLGEELKVIEKKGMTYWFIPKDPKAITPEMGTMEDGKFKLGTYARGALESLKNPIIYKVVSEAVVQTLKDRNETGQGLNENSFEEALEEA